MSYFLIQSNSHCWMCALNCINLPIALVYFPLFYVFWLKVSLYGRIDKSTIFHSLLNPLFSMVVIVVFMWHTHWTKTVVFSCGSIKRLVIFYYVSVSRLSFVLWTNKTQISCNSFKFYALCSEPLTTKNLLMCSRLR